MNEHPIFIRRPTVAETPMTYEFDVSGIKFLVKNLTDGDIYVALGASAEKQDCLLIPPETSQIVTAYDGTYVQGSDVVAVIPEATSEKGVEIQCLKW